MQVVDWEGDGAPDLLLGGYITGYIWFYEDRGINRDGTPQLTFRGPLEADGKPIDTIWGASPCAVDLDGDGDLDLLSGSFGQSMGGGDAVSEFLIYYKNLGTRMQPKLTREAIQYANKPPEDILAQARALDFNRDGLFDIVGVSWSGQMEWYRNRVSGDPQFAAPQKIEFPPTVIYSPRLSIVDWNQDGDDDYLMNSSYPWFCWLEGSYVERGYVRGRILKIEKKNK